MIDICNNLIFNFIHALLPATTIYIPYTFHLLWGGIQLLIL